MPPEGSGVLSAKQRRSTIGPISVLEMSGTANRQRSRCGYFAGTKIAVRVRTRPRSIWKYTDLFLTVLIVAGVWLYLVWHEPETPGPPAPSNSLSSYILAGESGPVMLANLIDESDWETACLIEEGMDPALAVDQPITRTIIKSEEPLANRHFLTRLWKIAIIKGNVAAIYYFDNRQIRRIDSGRCVPLQRAMLGLRSDTEPRTATLYDRSSSID